MKLVTQWKAIKQDFNSYIGSVLAITDEDRNNEQKAKRENKH